MSFYIGAHKHPELSKTVRVTSIVNNRKALNYFSINYLNYQLQEILIIIIIQRQTVVYIFNYIPLNDNFYFLF